MGRVSRAQIWGLPAVRARGVACLCLSRVKEAPVCFPRKCMLWIHPTAHLCHPESTSVAVSLAGVKIQDDRKERKKVKQKTDKTSWKTELIFFLNDTGCGRQDSRGWGWYFSTGPHNCFSLGWLLLFSRKMAAMESRYIPAHRTPRPIPHFATQCFLCQT